MHLSTVFLLILARHVLVPAVRGGGLEYEIELQDGGGGMRLQVCPVCSSWNRRSPITKGYCGSVVGVRPTVIISQCSQAMGPARVTALSTLITVAEVAEGTCPSNSSQAIANVAWQVNLPTPLNGADCLRVLVKESILGPGPAIAETRFMLSRENYSSNVEAVSICLDQGADDLCEVLDSASSRGMAPVLLLRLSSGKYFIQDTETGLLAALPECIGSEIAAIPQWTLKLNLTCSENQTRFVPSKLYAVSKREIFVTGNGLMFSPNRGGVIYELLLPNSRQLGSFVISSQRLFAVITRCNDSVPTIWIGAVGTSEVTQIFPSALATELLDLDSEPTWWNDLSENATLEFNHQDDLYLVDGDHRVRIPLLLALLHRSTESNFSPSNTSVELPLSSVHTHTPLQDYSTTAPHFLLHTQTEVCSYNGVTVEAPSCDKVTRSKLVVEQEGGLKWIEESVLPERDCSQSSSSLPLELFLQQSQSYNFFTHFTIDPTLKSPDELRLVVQVSDPEVIGVEIVRSFHSSNNSLSFEVILTEENWFTEQFESGYIAVSVDVHFWIWGHSLKCLDVFSLHPTIPGWLHTTVHVGCPPGVSLLFDEESTVSAYEQHCNPTNNITCYYFNNEFHPIFLTADSVTGERILYSGPYTLRAVAGGSSPNSLRHFDPSENVEVGLWTSVNGNRENVYTIEDNAIQWVCSSKSVCGEIVPADGNTPEYYLVLEASNRVVGENETYCDLTVQFTIRIHGMGMGSITVVITQLCVLAVLVTTTLLLYPMWHFRLSLFHWRDRAMEALLRRLRRARDSIAQLIRRQRRTHSSSWLIPMEQVGTSARASITS